MLITFSGLDGAGKSTLIECLKESLERRNKQVAILHMYYDVGVMACARFMFRKIAGGRKSESERTHAPRKQTEGRAPLAARIRYAVAWNKSLRLFIYPLDLLIFICYRLYVERMKKQVLIMDRYFYDTLVDITEGQGPRRVRFLMGMTPRPSVPVLIDISPEEAYARKGEHSIAYLRRRRLSYRELFPKGPGAVVLAGGDDLNITRRELEKIVMEKMASL